MGKIKWQELEQARREGMGYALKIAREKGLEGLEKEVSFRNISHVSITIPEAAFEEIIRRTKHQCIDTILLLSSLVLHDEFDFGTKRLARFVDRFNIKADCIAEDYTTWQEQLKIMEDECKIKLGIRFNDEDVNVNDYR